MAWVVTVGGGVWVRLGIRYYYYQVSAVVSDVPEGLLDGRGLHISSLAPTLAFPRMITNLRLFLDVAILAGRPRTSFC